MVKFVIASRSIYCFSIYFPLHLLYLRSLHSSYLNKGDALVDAAIEAYAADRDVTEFLDTLQILSSHTPEGDYSENQKYDRQVGRCYREE